MKENVYIEFNIDYEVNIYADNNLIGKSGYHDVYAFSIDKDCLLTFKNGSKKAMIKAFKNKKNKIEVCYSTTGQLKANYKNEDEIDKVTPKKTENKNFQELSSKSENIKNIKTNSNTNSNDNNDIGIFGGIMTLVCIGLPIFFLVRGCTERSIPSETYIEGGSSAERHALSDIPDDALVLFDTVMEGELVCKADSRTEDAIVLVKCTTTHEEIIKKYGKTIWYGFQSSADMSKYKHKTASTKEEVLKAFKK